MAQGNARRHQMVFPEQQAIYDYWRGKCRGESLPSDADICPSELPGDLSMVSYTAPEPCPRNPGDTRFFLRLAGTGFWRFYGSEIQGRYIDELPIGCRADYWARALAMVVDDRRPYHGVTKPNTPRGSHMAQFWMRLPLSSDGTNVDCILGYDVIRPLEDALAPAPKRRPVYA